MNNKNNNNKKKNQNNEFFFFWGGDKNILFLASGIPQRTILGALLFLAFINDFPDSRAKHSDTRLFADDSLLFRQIKGQKDAELLEQNLTALEEWEK